MRIPNPDNDPILLIHPLFDAAEAYTRMEESSPAFSLYDQGLDVWMINIRGNTFSRRHQTLDPIWDKEFWDYYLDDIRYDIMATVSLIKQETSFPKVALFGHSFGSTVLSFALALEPEFFDENTSISILAAPTISLAHTNSPLYSFLGNYPVILQTVWGLGIRVMSDQNPILSSLIYTF